MTRRFYSQVATQQKWKHMSTQTLVITNIHGNVIHNSQKVETTQMPINTWKGKQNRVYPYDGMLLLLLLSRFSRVRLLTTPQTVAHQAPLPMGFSRQEYWSGLPFPSPMHESEKWKWSCSVMSNPQRPHGLQPTRLLHPWDFPGKSAGVGCHCLLQCMKVKSESEVTQSCPTLSDPMDCSPPGSSIHGIFQARVLEWGAIASLVGYEGWISLKDRWKY